MMLLAMAGKEEDYKQKNSQFFHSYKTSGSNRRVVTAPTWACNHGVCVCGGAVLPIKFWVPLSFPLPLTKDQLEGRQIGGWPAPPLPLSWKAGTRGPPICNIGNITANAPVKCAGSTKALGRHREAALIF